MPPMLELQNFHSLLCVRFDCEKKDIDKQPIQDEGVDYDQRLRI
jgi:hypothetical protein